jgi:hypothetical protein
LPRSHILNFHEILEFSWHEDYSNFRCCFPQIKMFQQYSENFVNLELNLNQILIIYGIFEALRSWKILKILSSRIDNLTQDVLIFEKMENPGFTVVLLILHELWRVRGEKVLLSSAEGLALLKSQVFSRLIQLANLTSYRWSI